MKKMFAVMLFLLQVGPAAYTASAGDCPGGYQVMPNYRPGQGGPCKQLGLNSRQGVCQPGQPYETLCDDASGGRYKTCRGPKRCNNIASPPPTTNNNGQDCPGGYQVMSNYRPERGGPCKQLGLNSRQGVCQPGQPYETLCDDASGGRYKTCRGPKRCR